jgi:hypothetical protein
MPLGSLKDTPHYLHQSRPAQNDLRKVTSLVSVWCCITLRSPGTANHYLQKRWRPHRVQGPFPLFIDPRQSVCASNCFGVEVC